MLGYTLACPYPDCRADVAVPEGTPPGLARCPACAGVLRLWWTTPAHPWLGTAGEPEDAA